MLIGKSDTTCKTLLNRTKHGAKRDTKHDAKLRYQTTV